MTLSFRFAGPETTDLEHHPVAELMTPIQDVVWVEPSASVSECVDIFFSKNLRHLPASVLPLFICIYIYVCI